MPRRNRQALEAAIDAATNDGERAMAHYELGVFHDNNSRESDAIPHYEAALALGLDNPRRAECLAWLASSLFKTSRLEQALARVTQARRLTADDKLRTFLDGLERRILGRLHAGDTNLCELSKHIRSLTHTRPRQPEGVLTTTIDTLRAVLRQELHDEDPDAYRWADDVLDRHLTRATRELSLVLPRERKSTLSTTAGSHEVSIASLGELVRIEAVEYPTGEWPPCYAQFSVYETALTLLVPAAPAAVESLSVFWGSLHTLDGSTSTLPAMAEDAAVTGAAAYAALEWASFATNRANVSGAEAFEDYRTWGEERLKQFRQALRGFGRQARLRSALLYAPERTIARNTVQWPS